MTVIAADWISNADTQAICQMLTNAGYECYFVGGCVRNELLGAPVNDIDISTNALPNLVIELAKAAGLKSIPTGIEHGTVTVISGNTAFEITTYRRDVQTDGRHAVVAFADTIKEDALRRDFTINALYADANGVVLDPLNAMADLHARRVCFIENADQRIKEDYLRIMRFFRFHAWYGDINEGPDIDGLAACAANLAGLETVSKERIGTELIKLLNAPEPSPSIASMAASGVLNVILPGADAKYLPVLVHLENTISPDPIRRLATLGGQSAQKFLRLSNAQTKQLNCLYAEVGSLRSPAELGYRFGPKLSRDIILLRAALLEMPLDTDAFRQSKKGEIAVFPVKAVNLMPVFQGKPLGEKLKQLEQNWIDSDFSLTQEQLLAQLNKFRLK